MLVGHVTKEGALAGPRVLEHIVDTVLYFEGDTHSSFRLVRAIKNRFGAVNEIGVFAMTEKGLKGVANPSAIFLSTHGGITDGRPPYAVTTTTRCNDTTALDRDLQADLSAGRVGLTSTNLVGHRYS